MLKIGLTGGIGSGKSLVSRVFKHLKIPVYESDIEAKRLMNTVDSLKSGIISVLGEKAYEKGILNRKYIASVVFNDPEKLHSLNELVHPAVRDDFIHWTKEHLEYPYVIQEAAILFESGFDRFFDFIIYVFADEELRIRRVMHRDSVKREDVLKRMKQQLPEENKKKLSDYILLNNEGNLILPQVLDLHDKFISLQKQKK
ncbi:MAG: dephospho-CoA kinase [Bacteroidota bacterium]